MLVWTELQNRLNLGEDNHEPDRIRKNGSRHKKLAGTVMLRLCSRWRFASFAYCPEAKWLNIVSNVDWLILYSSIPSFPLSFRNTKLVRKESIKEACPFVAVTHLLCSRCPNMSAREDPSPYGNWEIFHTMYEKYKETVLKVQYRVYQEEASIGANT